MNTAAQRTITTALASTTAKVQKDKQVHVRLSATELKMWHSLAAELRYKNLSAMLRDAIEVLKEVRDY